MNRSLGEAIARGSRWYTTPEGHTMAIMGGLSDALVAGQVRSPGDTLRAESWDARGATRRAVKGRPFAIATTETTVGQFLRFRPSHRFSREDSPESSCPVNDVDL